MINDDKRVLEHFSNLLDCTKDKEKITVNRQNIVYLVNKLEKYFEQAERVQELEKETREWEIVNECWEEINTNLVEQNRRYCEALEFINEELELVLHSNKGLSEKMFYIENSKRKITESLEGESNE